MAATKVALNGSGVVVVALGRVPVHRVANI